MLEGDYLQVRITFDVQRLIAGLARKTLLGKRCFSKIARLFIRYTSRLLCIRFSASDAPTFWLRLDSYERTPTLLFVVVKCTDYTSAVDIRRFPASSKCLVMSVTTASRFRVTVQFKSGVIVYVALDLDWIWIGLCPSYLHCFSSLVTSAPLRRRV